MWFARRYNGVFSLSLVLMLTALLSLNCSFVLKSSLSFCTFWKKVPKTGAVVYGIRCFKLTTSPFRTPCGANYVCTAHDYMLSMLSICRANSQIANSIRCCNILQSVRTSPVAAFRNAWGGKNSLRSNIMPPVSAHCLAARCASQRCPLDKLLTLAAKAQTSLAFARLRITFALGGGLPLQ